MKTPGAWRPIAAVAWIACGLAVFGSVQTASTALAQTDAAAREHATDKLKVVVILSRHGVRSPTWTQARLDAYSALPWPEWKVEPGYLTEHGFELLKRFGSYDRAALAQDGLVAAQGCADAAATYIWADTDERTTESGRALAEGLFPGCAPAVNGLAAGAHDPLFHPGRETVSAADADAAFAEVSARVKAEGDAEQSDLIAAMQNVLLGCAPKGACSAAQKPSKMLGPGSEAVARGTGDHLVELQGPLAEASSFAEDFMLEYTDGMPAEKVGWGKVDEPQLKRFLALHSNYFDLVHRTPTLARLEASNLLERVVGTLQQHAEGKPLTNALGPPDSKLVMVVGHDTNVAGVAALLGLHWTLDGRRDDTPPGMELAFELRQSERGDWSVRVRASVQTLDQMRDLRGLTLAAPPALETLQISGCGSAARVCNWREFQKIALAATGKDAGVAASSK